MTAGECLQVMDGSWLQVFGIGLVVADNGPHKYFLTGLFLGREKGWQPRDVGRILICMVINLQLHIRRPYITFVPRHSQ